MQRRERTRHLIELAGDDRATLLGGLRALADMFSGEGGEALVEVWRHRGLRAFDATTLT